MDPDLFLTAGLILALLTFPSILSAMSDGRAPATLVLVGVVGRSSWDAFQAAEYLMDYLKSRAPFWKKEITRDGASWVAARASSRRWLSLARAET